mmetsp:Transcript_53950/g.89375  ORF Transcript_53950/g.89375 Transcript_53950/m.89375 type:complete len:253 (-) Transcript_53950:82-840(-)
MDKFEKSLSTLNKSFLSGCAVGAFITFSAYFGYSLYTENKNEYNKKFAQICKESHAAKDADVNRMLQVCATIIAVNGHAYLSTVDNASMPDHQYPCCRMMAIKPIWKPPATLSHMYIGTNNTSRKYKQLQTNKHAVVSFGDAAGHGYVSLYGELREVTNEQKLESLFPYKWSAYPDGVEDPRFTVFRMNIAKIEFVSNRFGYDSKAQDWRPFILNRMPNTLEFDTAKWIVCDKAKKWRVDYSGYLVFDDHLQ